MKQNQRSARLKETLHQQFKTGYAKGYSKGYTDAVHFTIENYTAILLICLKDKFDFTPEQLKTVSDHINNQFDSVTKGYVTFEDILATLDQETGLHVAYLTDADMEKEGDSGDQS